MAVQCQSCFQELNVECVQYYLPIVIYLLSSVLSPVHSKILGKGAKKKGGKYDVLPVPGCQSLPGGGGESSVRVEKKPYRFFGKVFFFSEHAESF